MRIGLTKRVLIVALWLAVLTQSGYHMRNNFPLPLDGTLLRTGDIILRRGTSVVSYVALATDRESQFSHAGLIYKAGGETFVIHAAPADSVSASSEESYVQIEPLATFLSADHASRAAVFRLDEAYRRFVLNATTRARRYVEEQRTFDYEFDLGTTDKLYCTELVWRAYLEAGIDITEGHFDKMAIFLEDKDKHYILPSSLATSRLLHQVAFAAKP